MCDAVQAETYKIDGVEVSNFVLPLYFTGSEEVGGRNDFLGGSHNPQTGQQETFSRKGDQEAQERMKIKLQAKAARRAIRYQPFPVHSAAAKKAGQQPRRP